MKTSIYAALLTIVATSASVIPAAQAVGPSDAKVPHLTSSGAGPNNPRHSHLDSYFIRIHVTGRSLTQLVIEAPSGVQLSEAIAITDQSGKPISATVSLNGQKATLAFAQSISPDTKLEIDLKNVKTPHDTLTWFFSVSGQLSGLNAEIPLGLARIQPRLND